jgi:hypothetical protein
MEPDRGRMLMAFRDETEHLTRREIMARAGVAMPIEFDALLNTKLLVQDEWMPNRPNLYHMTPRGIDRRQMYREMQGVWHG